MFFSLFSISAPAGFSSIQVQKTATECLRPENQHPSGLRVFYAEKRTFASLPNWNIQIRTAGLAALHKHTQLYTIRFNRLLDQFELLKSGIAIACGATNPSAYQKEPADM
ncbi:hypothetical protein [Pedobacter antarcticus]|uniref:hypothetical protein n=1 Tax=Pedobacter antarcticus TaxID=34086 RepID=UPI00292EDE36|nr:hypothetical protein [Pedobacter antarcticus]